MNAPKDAATAAAEAAMEMEIKIAREKAEAERENSLQEEVRCPQHHLCVGLPLELHTQLTYCVAPPACLHQDETTAALATNT